MSEHVPPFDPQRSHRYAYDGVEDVFHEPCDVAVSVTWLPTGLIAIVGSAVATGAMPPITPLRTLADADEVVLLAVTVTSTVPPLSTGCSR